MTSNLKHLQTAKKASAEAGKILVKNFGKSVSISLKQRDDYLSNVDVLAENKIKSIIKSEYPNHNICAEESDFENNRSEYTWNIDPISSTRNFIHTLHGFSVAISLIHKNNVMVATVFDPIRDELFYAIKNNGAYLNDKRIQVSKISQPKHSLIICDINKRGATDLSRGLNYFSKLLALRTTLRSIGSNALELCYVASGRADALAYDYTDIFCIPAGKLILEESGGKITDFSGKPWTLKSKTTLGSNGIVHEAFVDILNK